MCNIWIYYTGFHGDCVLQVLELGNKTYEHYNIFGHIVDKMLEECGTVRVCEHGEGDDDGKWVQALCVLSAIVEGGGSFVFLNWLFHAIC